MSTSSRKTRRPRHAAGAKGPVVAKPVRHIRVPTGEARGVAGRDDTALDAPLERDVDSVEATQLDAIFEEPLHVDDDAIINDADGAGSRRR